MIAYGYDGGRARLLMHTTHGAYNDELLIEVLLDLRRYLRGAPATIVWDGLPSHRSRVMKAFLAQQRSWLITEHLPGYAPELNPVEALWSSLKGSEFANRCDDTVSGLEDTAEIGATRVGSNQQLMFSFLAKSGLSF
jgi:transposase